VTTLRERPRRIAASRRSPSSRLTIAVVTGSLYTEELDLWRVCAERHRMVIVGTTYNPVRHLWPWSPEPPPDLDTVVLDPLSPFPKRGRLWWMYRRLGSALTEIRPDVVHVLSEPWGLLVSQSLALRPRHHARVCAHGCDNRYHFGPRWEQFIRRNVLRVQLPRLDGFASWNSDGLRLARAAGLGSQTPGVVVPAVVPDPDVFRPASLEDRQRLREELGLPLGEVVVGFVGRLSREKGLPDLFDALASLGEGAPWLAVWGVGPLEDLVRSRLGVGDLRGKFFGKLDPTSVARASRACDIVVLPSRETAHWSEQFGRALVEGILSGCVGITYGGGSMQEVAAGAALIVDNGDVRSLAEAIARVTHDPDLRMQLAVAGRDAILRRYDPRVLAATLDAFWADVTSA
jgi:glycosyltransferase involved in cell wall biosynthesis